MKILANFFNLIAILAIMTFVGYNWDELHAQPIEYNSLENISEKDITCLAKNIYFESRNQSIQGQEAVAWVTLNRLDHHYFPDSICGVVEQANRDSAGNLIKGKCQFSWFCDGKPDIIGSDTLSQRSWIYAQVTARSVLRSWADNEQSPIDNAIMFHANYVKPRWAASFDRVAVIGDHVFYQ